jgi:hypothetical protein
MKYTMDLLSAMAVVERACEKGEITIIGEGAKPKPAELLAKCAKFIEAQYGVSVKMLAIVDGSAVSYDTECACSYDCHADCEECPACEDAEGALDEEAVEVGKFDAEGIAEYLDDMLYDRLDQIAECLVGDAIHAIVAYYERLDGKPTEELEVEDISGGIYDILEDIDGLKCSLAEEVASDIENYVLARFYEVVEE